MPAGAYNSLWQVRTDAWSTLEESTAQLALRGARHHPAGPLADTVAEALDVLAPIERFWAFPGMRAFYRVRRLFATGKYDRCATVVSRINRSLATDSYRSSQTWDAEDDAYDREPSQADRAGARPPRPYFEVLIVEDMTDDQERVLREELRRWRRPDDQFVYEVVVVPSFDDALMAARVNFRLQACVVRRRFAHRSRHATSSLRQFVSMLGSDNLMDRPPDERAQVLARSLARIRPELDLYLMTEVAVEDMAGRLSHHFRRIFHTREGHQSHHYGLMLAGAMVTYLDAYRLNQYSMYGAVPITEIKGQLLALRRAGKLDRVTMLLLTNCTFDGIVYDVQRVMQECLAIVHGYRADAGYRVYVDKALEIAATTRPAPPPDPADPAGPAA